MNGTRRPLTFHLSEAHSFWCFEGPSVFTGIQDFGMLRIYCSGRHKSLEAILDTNNDINKPMYVVCIMKRECK